MKIVKYILIGIGLCIVLFLGSIFIGIPSFQDKYLEKNTNENKFLAYQDHIVKCEIEVRPEVLDRLIVEVSFEQINNSKGIIKDFDLIVEANGIEQPRIFDIYLSKYSRSPIENEEIKVKDFNELPQGSEYRHIPIKIQPQYSLNHKDNFEFHLSFVLIDPGTNQESRISKIFHIKNAKEFKLTKFRGH